MAESPPFFVAVGVAVAVASELSDLRNILELRTFRDAGIPACVRAGIVDNKKKNRSFNTDGGRNIAFIDKKKKGKHFSPVKRSKEEGTGETRALRTPTTYFIGTGIEGTR